MNCKPCSVITATACAIYIVVLTNVNLTNLEALFGLLSLGVIFASMMRNIRQIV